MSVDITPHNLSECQNISRMEGNKGSSEKPAEVLALLKIGLRSGSAGGAASSHTASSEAADSGNASGSDGEDGGGAHSDEDEEDEEDNDDDYYQSQDQQDANGGGETATVACKARGLPVSTTPERLLLSSLLFYNSVTFYLQ